MAAASLPVLGVPGFRKYLLAGLFAALGTGMYFVAVSWYLFSLSHSTLAVGWSLVASALPGLLLSPVVGHLVDRWNVKRICVGADLARAALLTAVALGMVNHSLTPVHIYVATFFIALCDNFFQPAIGALVRDIVEKDDLLRANVSSSFALQVGTLAGAGVGGFVVAALGTSAVVAVNALCFAASAVLILTIRHRQSAPAPMQAAGPEDGVWRKFRRAVADVPQRGWLYTVVLQQVLAYLTVFVCNTLLPGFVAKDLLAGSQGFGLIDAAWGCGALSGGLLLAAALKRLSPVMAGAAGLLGLGGGLAVMGSAVGIAHAAAAYLVLGALGVALRINGDTEIARVVSREHFGKFKSAVVMVVSWSSLTVYLGIGGLADIASSRTLYLAMGALVTAAAIGMLVVLRAQRSGSAQVQPR